MGQTELTPPRALPAKVSPFVKGVANNNVKAEANGYLSGATEPPLPVTRERLELIKACAKGRCTHRRRCGNVADRQALCAPRSGSAASRLRSACRAYAPDLAADRAYVRDPHAHGRFDPCRFAA